jgi:hypothetical protein
MLPVNRWVENLFVYTTDTGMTANFSLKVLLLLLLR